MEIIIALMLAGMAFLWFFVLVRKWMRHRAEMNAMDAQIEARDDAIRMQKVGGQYYARNLGASAAPPSQSRQDDSSNALLYGMAGYLIGSSGNGRSEVTTDNPQPAFLAGGGDSGGAGASASWDDSSSRSSSYDSGSSSSSDSSSSSSDSNSSSSDSGSSGGGSSD